jgi:hypothetical protein
MTDKRDDFATSDDLASLAGFASLHIKGGTYFAKQLGEFIISQAKRTGAKMLEFALEDGKITEAEIARLIEEYDATRADVAEIFKYFYDKGIAMPSPDKETKVFMVTMKDSPIWKMRHYIKETYGMGVMTVQEATAKMREGIDSNDHTYIG